MNPVITNILEDGSTDRVATRIPLSGSIDNPDADIWSTLGGLLKNAFIVSLRRGLEGSVKLGGEAP